MATSIRKTIRMQSRPSRHHRKMVAALAPLLMAGGAFAAEQADEEQGATLGSVVVTAQKREEKIQDVPIPITAIAGDTIRDRNINSSTDIERLAPNLSAQATGGRSAKPRWFLRGIGTNDPNANNEGPIGVYVDEVVVGLQGNQNFPIFDLDRVEVLRGPQGTLWGKNNTGGTIHFVSKKPTYDKEGYVLAGVGNYGSRRIEGAFGGALQEEALLGRASFYYEKSDGWARNIVSGENGPQLQDFATRLQLLANPAPDLEALFSVRLRRRDGGNLPSYLVGATSSGGVTRPNANGAIAQGGGSYIPPYGANPDTTSDFWAGDGYNKQDTNGATMRLTYQLGANTLTSISAVDTSQGKNYAAVGIPFGTTLDQTSTRSNDSSRQVTQELRLASPKTERVSWILGAYYYNQKASAYTQSARFNNTEQYTEASWDQKSISRALYGNTRVAVTDKAAVTLGLRQTWESKRIDETSLTASDNVAGTAVIFNIPNAWWLPGATTGSAVVPAARASASETWSRATWDLTPEYRFHKDLLGYARVATGFRSGGFNQAMVNNAIIRTNPETIRDYELGMKSTWLGGRLNANAALFYYDIRNLQLNIQQIVPGTTITSTAGSANGNIKGFELELEALPVDRLRLSGSLGLLRSRYTDFTYRLGGVALDASGNEFYRTPRTSLRVGATYTIPWATGGQAVLDTDWSYRSHIFHNATVQNDPIQETPAFWTGNARISYRTANKKIQISAFVNNVTNQSQKILSQIVNTRGVYPTSFAAPRLFGVQATLYY